jgi:hypothetical protein
VQRSRRRPLLLRSTANLNRVEDLLLEAVVRTHPNRERALDRLLDEVCRASCTAAVEVAPAIPHVAADGADAADDDGEERARVEFDRTIDNDFDGLS